MTDKELTQIEAWLSGQGRYKLFDTERLSVLRELDGNEFKVWFYLWTQERGRQESWVKNETIAKETGVSLSTVKRVRKRLIGCKWVIYTGSTAADNYVNPTVGARLVRSVRVDDPTKGQTDPLGQNEPEGVSLNRVNLNPNVSTAFASAVAFASTSVSTPTSTCTRSEVRKDDDSLRSSEEQKPKQPQQQKQQPRSTSATKWLARYGEEKPADFESWSQVDRTRWCIEHSDRVVQQEKLAASDERVTIAHIPVKPNPTTPPLLPEPEPKPEVEVDYNPTPAHCRCDWCGVNVPAEFLNTHECEGWGNARKSKSSLRCPDCGDLKEDCLCY